jgi:hypothetical protein
MSLKKSKTLFIVLFSIVLIGFGGYSYLYKSHKNIESAKVNYSGKSIEFLKEVKENRSLWLDKTIVLTGIISQIDKNGIVLDYSVYCQFKNLENSKLSIQTQITIKGNMIGYDDLLEEVKLNQCIIQK